MYLGHFGVAVPDYKKAMKRFKDLGCTIIPCKSKQINMRNTINRPCIDGRVGFKGRAKITLSLVFLRR